MISVAVFWKSSVESTSSRSSNFTRRAGESWPFLFSRETTFLDSLGMWLLLSLVFIPLSYQAREAAVLAGMTNGGEALRQQCRATRWGRHSHPSTQVIRLKYYDILRWAY